MLAELVQFHNDTITPVAPIKGRERIMAPLVGEVTSHLHRIREPETERPKFVAVFPDLSVRQEGLYCLQCHLYEVTGSDVLHRVAVKSNTFRVYAAKEFPGMAETTPLTLMLKNHAVRVKTSKSIRGKVKYMNEVHPLPSLLIFLEKLKRKASRDEEDVEMVISF